MRFSKGAAGIMSIALLGAPMAMFSTGCAATGQVAATVNGENIEEETITNYVQDFRKANSLEDNDAWAQWMVDNGRDAASVREDAIDYFVQLALIDQDAKEKGINVTDDEVNAQYDEIKGYYGFSDEEFDQQLEDLGYTEASYKDYLRQSLIQERLMETVSSDDEVNPEEVLSTANSYSSILNGAKRITSIVVEDETVANDLKAKADAGEDFATLASENSITSDYDGWDVLMGIDQTVYEALENANKGTITNVIPSDDGTRYFVIKVDDVLNVDAEKGFSSVDEIPAELYTEFESTVKQSAASTEFDTYLQGLKDAAEITINPMPSGMPYDVSTEGVEASQVAEDLVNDTAVVDENGNPVETDETDVATESIEGETSTSTDTGQVVIEGEPEVEAGGGATEGTEVNTN